MLLGEWVSKNFIALALQYNKEKMAKHLRKFLKWVTRNIARALGDQFAIVVVVSVAITASRTICHGFEALCGTPFDLKLKQKHASISGREPWPSGHGRRLKF